METFLASTLVGCHVSGQLFIVNMVNWTPPIRQPCGMPLPYIFHKISNYLAFLWCGSRMYILSNLRLWLACQHCSHSETN